MNLLLADQSRDMLSAFGSLLTARGYPNQTAFDGVQVLQRLRTQRFDLLIVNRDLPRVRIEAVVQKAQKAPALAWPM